MANRSIAEQIVAWAETQCRALTTANGYTFTAATVSRKMPNPAQAKTTPTPAVYVYASEDHESTDPKEGGAFDRSAHTLILYAAALAKAAAGPLDPTRETVGREMLSDVTQCLARQNFFLALDQGGEQRVEILPVKTDVFVDTPDNDFAGGSVTFQVKFRTKTTQPRTGA